MFSSSSTIRMFPCYLAIIAFPYFRLFLLAAINIYIIVHCTSVLDVLGSFSE